MQMLTETKQEDSGRTQFQLWRPLYDITARVPQRETRLPILSACFLLTACWWNRRGMGRRQEWRFLTWGTADLPRCVATMMSRHLQLQALTDWTIGSIGVPAQHVNNYRELLHTRLLRFKTYADCVLLDTLRSSASLWEMVFTSWPDT